MLWGGFRVTRIAQGRDHERTGQRRPEGCRIGLEYLASADRHFEQVKGRDGDQSCNGHPEREKWRGGPAQAVIVEYEENGPVVEIEAIGYEADPAQRSQ